MKYVWYIHVDVIKDYTRIHSSMKLLSSPRTVGGRVWCVCVHKYLRKLARLAAQTSYWQTSLYSVVCISIILFTNVIINTHTNHSGMYL